MKISRKHVANVARMARIRLSKEQEKLFALQLENILEYMERLNKVDTRGVEPTCHIIPIQNAFREDEVRSSLPKKMSLHNAPGKTEDFFLVPRVI